MMKLVSFPLVVDTEANAVTLPDSIDKFTSLYFDGAALTVQAAYTGELELNQLPGSVKPQWDVDTQQWAIQNAYRTELTKKELTLSFTPAEYRALQTATDTDDTLYQLWQALTVADFVELTDPTTVNGMAYILALGLLTQERHDEIMRGISTWQG